jgi:hypothetical protein
MFAEALKEVVGRLDRATQAGLLRGYALIGGLAAGVWGLPRATHDVDFALVPATTETSAIADALGAQFHASGPGDPLRGVFQTTVPSQSRAVPVQLILLPGRWNEVILKDVETVSVLGCAVPVVAWPTLVLLKVYAGGPQDLLDAASVMTTRTPSAKVIAEMKGLAETVGVSAELATLLKQMGHDRS